MKVLSLFDGISCARVALERAGLPVELYLASEVDKYAIQISSKNYPDIIHIGDVKNVSGTYEYDLIIGGSPCQDLSIAKKNRQGLSGEKSSLFWEYARILKNAKPKYFILENVASMPKDARDEITSVLGVEPIMINAALVSAQNRKRLFWTNIPNVTQPQDKGILLKDILIDGIAEREKSLVITATYSRACPQDYFGKSSRQLIKVGHFNKGGQGDRVYSPEGKSVALSELGGGRGAKTGLYAVALTERRTEEAKQLRREYKERTGKDFSPRRMKELVPRDDNKMNTITTGLTKNSLVLQDSIIRKLTPVECERLQGLPDNYTEGVSNTQRYKALGNAFNVDVIAHILSFIPKN